MPLPNLVLAGFPKCGTTSVAEALVSHPEVCGSFPHLRTRYFTPLLYDADAVLPPTSHYASHYKKCRGESVLLDDTPVWIYGGERMARRVRDVLGNPRVLVMMREPVSRTASYLAWKKRHGEIDQHLRLPDYARQCRDYGPKAVDTADLNPYSGLYGSDYARFLGQWVDVFGPDLRVGYLDNLKDEAGTFYRALAQWLEISPDSFATDAFEIANPRKAVRSPRAERMIRRVGRVAGPLAQHTPPLYRALRKVARRLNMTDPPRDKDDSAALDDLREFFAPGLGTLATVVRGRELATTPEWLAGR